MKFNPFSLAASAAFAAFVSASPATAGSGYLLPGQTMGGALAAPLPTGVYAFSSEYYYKADGGALGAGVNIPGLIWSTPWSVQGTRLELLATFPFVHLDGTINRIGAVTQAYGPLLTHDFGGGWGGGIAGFLRTPDPTNTTILGTPGAFLFHNRVGADFYQSLQYNGAIAGITGLSLSENAYYSSTLRSASVDPYINDLIGGDFTIRKRWGRFTAGFTGFGYTGLENRPLSGGRDAKVHLGGLIGYDFDKVSVTAIVSRAVMARLNGANAPALYDTRGQLGLVVPLYVEAPVPARPLH